MRIVHLAIQPTVQPTKKGKLADNKQAIQAGLLAWKLKHNEKLDKQQKQS